MTGEPLAEAQAVLDALPDAVVVAGADGLVRYVNDKTCRLTGRRHDELIGADIEALMPARFRAAHQAGFHRVAAGGEPRLLGGPIRVPVLHADGTEREVDLIISILRDDTAGLTVVASLRDVAGQIAMERAVEASRFLTASVEVTDRLHRARTLDEGLSAVLPTLCAQLDWDLATMWVVESDGELLRCADVWSRPGSSPAALMEQASLHRRFRAGEGLPGRVFDSMSPVLLPDLATEESLPRLRAAIGSGFRCAAALPLVSGKDVLGVIELFNRTPGKVSDEMIRTMEAVGRQIGSFIDRLRAEEQLRELADTLQASLLPPQAPDIPGLDIETLYRSGVAGLSVGGDIYDIFPAGSGRWVVLIGDVCGKGAPAAATTSVARYAARAAAIDHADDPARVLTTVNEALLRDSIERPFLTAACAILVRRSSGALMTLAVAGHPLPIVVGRAGRVEEVGVPGQLLGILPGIEVQSVDVELEGGDTAFFYTDGLVEARSRGGGQFGDDRLREMLASYGDLPLPRLVHDVARAATQFAGGAPQDDMAVVALRPCR